VPVTLRLRLCASHFYPDPKSLFCGRGSFVDATLHESEKFLESKYRLKETIDNLIKLVADEVGVSPELICSGSRQRRLCEARARVACLAVGEAGHSAAEVGRHLGIRRVSVLRLAKRGLVIIGNMFKMLAGKVTNVPTSPIHAEYSGYLLIYGRPAWTSLSNTVYEFALKQVGE
jgi:hypothetical protein